MRRPERVLLLVDGETARATRLAQRLTALDVEVETAANGAEGLLKAHDLQPDVVVVAADVPILDGCRMLDALRSQPRTHHIPTILILNGTRPDELARAWGSGADLCIPGGPCEADLWASLHRALQTTHTLPALRAEQRVPSRE